MRTAIIVHNTATGNIWIEDERGRKLINTYFKTVEIAQKWCKNNSYQSTLRQIVECPPDAYALALALSRIR